MQRGLTVWGDILSCVCVSFSSLCVFYVSALIMHFKIVFIVVLYNYFSRRAGIGYKYKVLPCNTFQRVCSCTSSLAFWGVGYALPGAKA